MKVIRLVSYYDVLVDQIMYATDDHVMMNYAY